MNRYSVKILKFWQDVYLLFKLISNLSQEISIRCISFCCQHLMSHPRAHSGHRTFYANLINLLSNSMLYCFLILFRHNSHSIIIIHSSLIRCLTSDFPQESKRIDNILLPFHRGGYGGVLGPTTLSAESSFFHSESNFHLVYCIVPASLSHANV